MLPAAALADLTTAPDETTSSPPFVSQVDQVGEESVSINGPAPVDFVSSATLDAAPAPMLLTSPSPAADSLALIVSPSQGAGVFTPTPSPASPSSSGGASSYYSGGSGSAQPASASPVGGTTSTAGASAGPSSNTPGGDVTGSSSSGAQTPGGINPDGSTYGPSSGGAANPSQPVGGSGTTGALTPVGGGGTDPSGGESSGNTIIYQLGVQAIDPTPVGVDPSVPGSGVLQGTFVIWRDPADTDWSQSIPVTCYLQTVNISGAPINYFLDEGADYSIVAYNFQDVTTDPRFVAFGTAIPAGAGSTSVGIDVLENQNRTGDNYLQMKAYGIFSSYDPVTNIYKLYDGYSSAIMDISASTVVSIDSSTADTADGSTVPGSFSVSLNQSLSYNLTMPIQITGTAIAGVDYQTIGTVEDPNAADPVYDTSITIPAGQTEGSIPVVPLDDANQWGDRSVTATLDQGSQLFVPGSNASATVTIHDDKPTVTIVADQPDATEGDGSTGDFTVTRTGSTDEPLLVDYNIGGTAESGVDYSAISGTVTIAAGAVSATIPVVPTGGPSNQGDRTVTVNLALDGSTYNLAPSNSATVTIHDGEQSVSIVASIPDASEADLTSGQFDVSRIGSTDQPLEVDYTVGGTAVPGVDYQPLTGSVVIPAGATDATIDVIPTGNTSSTTDDPTVIVNLTSSDSYHLQGQSSAEVDFGSGYPVVADGSFETPAISSDISQGFVASPTGSPWTFGPGTGIAANGSEITSGDPSAPDGNQVAFLTGTGSFSQTINFASGNYQLTFAAGQQSSPQTPGTNWGYPGSTLPGQEDFEVKINGVAVGVYTPPGVNDEPYMTNPFHASGETQVQFIGINSNIQQDTVLIDNVAIQDAIGQTDTIQVPSSHDVPSLTATDSSGNLWFVGSPGYSSSWANQIGRLDTATGKITEDIVATPGYPTSSIITSITQGPDGAIWFGDGAYLGRIDPVTNAVSMFWIGTTAYELQSGPDGRLWFSGSNIGFDAFNLSDHSVSRYSPKYPGTNSFNKNVTVFQFGFSANGDIWYMGNNGTNDSWYPGGNLTFNANTNSCTIYDIDTATWQTVRGYTFDGWSGSGDFGDCNPPPFTPFMRQGPDGSLWFDDGAGDFGRIDPVTNDADLYADAYQVKSNGYNNTFPGMTLGVANTFGLAVGTDGAIWLGGYRFDPRTGTFNEIVSDLGYYNGQLTSASDNALYYSYSYGNGVGDPVFTRINLEDIQLDDEPHVYVSADDPETDLDASVTLGMDSDGNPLDATDGTTVYWKAEGPDATLGSPTATTLAGLASDVLHTSTHAGDTYQVIASTDLVDDTPKGQSDAEVKTETVTVVPGQAASITFTRSVDHLISDGQSSTIITLTARDAEGNLVADGTSVDWDLAGGGSLSNGSATTINGQAKVTLQAGVLPEDQIVTATIDGYQASTTVTSEAVNISLGITGNLLVLGTGMTATVTATVTDADGNPVPNGTPITWFTQKGSISGQTTVNGGVAYATLFAMGGSQVFGYGSVRAFVGSNAGSASYQWIPQFNGFTVKIGNPLLSGNSAIGGSYSVPQADGTTVAYSYDAQTVATISGPAYAVVQISAGMPGQPPTGILNLVGDGGQSGTATTVTLDANGNGSFLIQSLGNVQGGGLELPIAMMMNGDPSTTTVSNIALVPAQFIAQAKDYINQMGWAVLTGNADTMTGMAADVGFSLIPVVGAWTDIRDMGKELLNLWPGGESPNWVSFGFAAAGIFGSFLGPELDWIPTLLKKLSQQLGNTPLFQAVWQAAKSLDLQRLTGWTPILSVVAGFGSDDFLNLLVQTLVRNSDDLDKVNAMAKGLANGAADVEALLLRVATDPNLGPDAARRVMEAMGTLSASQLGAIQEAGKLNLIANTICKYQVLFSNLILTSINTNLVQISQRNLQKIFGKHGADFGLIGNWNPSRAADMKQAILDQLSSPSVLQFEGTYRGMLVTNVVDPVSGLNVVLDKARNVIAG